MKKLHTLAAASLLLAFPLAVSCSAGNEDGEPTGGTEGAGAGLSTGPGSGGNGQGGGFSNSSAQGTGGFSGCTGVSSTAAAQKQPADIIIAVDTSGSMNEESAEVQQNLNTFASIIDASGIDVRVVLIADASVCIPTPLGSGQCNGNDSQLEEYRHVVQTVSSSDSLQVILNTYPQWSPSMRPQASKTFLVVSDDNSDLGASPFTSQLLALDPQFQGFKFHAIVANSDTLACFGFSCPANNDCCYSPGFGCQSYGAAEGTVYKELVMQTGGVNGNLCIQEFDPIFQEMAQGVIVASQLSCEYAIPEPPPGEVLDPALVNVLYTPGGQPNAQPVLNVPGGAADCDPSGGWYYDNPQTPTKIIVCPATCSVLQADAQGKVDVEFGCATQVVPQ